MAYIKFKKEDEPSIKKNYQAPSLKAHKHRKIWKLIAMVEFIIILGLLTRHYVNL